MSENLTLLNAYLKEVLAGIASEWNEGLPEVLKPGDVGVEVN